MSFIYLVSPYGDPEQKVRDKRADNALKSTLSLFSQGEMVFSPILYGHMISNALEKYGAPQPTESEWKAFDSFILTGVKPKEVVVDQMQGWKESTGVKEEIYQAIACGIPVRKYE